MEHRTEMWRRWAKVVTVVVIGCVVAGCTGFAEQARADRDSEPEIEAREAADLLYESMVEVFRQDTEGVDFEHPDRLTVVSDYEDVAEQQRRRFVGRVVPAQAGLGVNITAEYQNDVADRGQEPEWEDQPRQLVEQKAEPDELSMARRIERLYHSGGP